MRGRLLEFSIKENKGYISADSGERFTFAGHEWKSSGVPKAGAEVDFVPKDDAGQAGEVFLLCTPAESPRSDKLYRKQSEAAWGGVCAGLAEKWHMSPDALRVATVVLTIIFFPVFFLYLILWLALPDVDSGRA